MTSCPTAHSTPSSAGPSACRHDHRTVETGVRESLETAERAERYLLEPGLRLLLADLGISAANVLRRAGLPPDLFARDQVKLTTANYYALWEALGEESADPHLPIRIGEAISVENFSPPIFAALCSPNLQVAARRIATYKRLIGPMRLTVSAEETETVLRFDWRSHADPPKVLANSELVFWVALARIGTREQVRPLRVTIRRPPADTAYFGKYLGCAIEAAPIQTIVFAASDAVRPFLTANESMWKFFEPELRRRLGELDRDASTSDRVEAALVELRSRRRHSDERRRPLPGGQHAYPAASPERRGNQLPGGAQPNAAVARQPLPPQRRDDRGQISFLLGYENPSSFYRAFHSWTGQAPESARTEA